jgi:hypothetical protein
MFELIHVSKLVTYFSSKSISYILATASTAALTGAYKQSSTTIFVPGLEREELTIYHLCSHEMYDLHLYGLNQKFLCHLEYAYSVYQDLLI